MRIRKYAAKLMPSSLPIFHSTPTTLTAITIAGAVGCSSSPSSSTTLAVVGTSYESPSVDRPPEELTVCHLNMSPWDLMSPYCPEDYFQDDLDYFDHHQEGKDEIVSCVIKGRRRSNSSAFSNRTQTQRNRQIETEKIDPNKCLKKPPLLTTTKKKKKKKEISWKKQAVTWATMKVEVKELNYEERQNLASVTADSLADGEGAICKKTDGKGWHCKKKAKHPHVLCEFHLSQIRTYYQATHILQSHDYHRQHETKTLPSGTGTKKKEKAKANKDGPEFYYYYNGFGPWMAKRRGGGERKYVTSVDDKRGCYTAVCGALEDGSDEELDPETIDNLEDYGGDVGPTKKRKGRKVIKARSLKSLL